ncbi:hypothetical protein ARMSODRAFT_1061495, partial [Armillaria solidipes]
PHVVGAGCTMISTEMNTFTKSLSVVGTSAITTAFIDSWTFDSSINHPTPVLRQFLLTAAQTELAKEKNKIKNPEKILNAVVRQLSYSRSNRSMEFQTMFGLFLWCTGCQRQTIEALHQCGLSISYAGVCTALAHLATQCLALAVFIGALMHVFCYDNVNISTSDFVEQRGSDTPAKVTSGTFAVLYPVRNGVPEHMLIAPILTRYRTAPQLDFNRDLRPSLEQRKSFHSQLKIIISKVLFDYCDKFDSDLCEHQSLQHKSRRRIPDEYITLCFPIPVSTIPEATTKDNIRFHDHVYLVKLGRNISTLSTRQVFQLGFGLFHACQTLVWALLHNHRGVVSQVGSLAYFFELMDKTRLGSAKPDYHTLLYALTQIFDGLILNAWRQECGYSSLEEFASSKPNPTQILDLSEKILNNYAVPLEQPFAPWKFRLGGKAKAAETEEADAEDEEDNNTSTDPCSIEDYAY